MPAHYLTALPVYNEQRHILEVLPQVRRYSRHVLVVDDGSRDRTPELLKQVPICVITHPTNRGYGAALASAFEYAIRERFEVLVTIDCDGQHQPALIPSMVEAAHRRDAGATGPSGSPSLEGGAGGGKPADIVSGSRYLAPLPGDSKPPEDRRRINAELTAVLNDRLGLNLTDAFCGFKAYRVEALRRLHLTEAGYAMPLELWVQAARLGLKIVEVPVPLIYLEEERSFGGALDDAETRRAHYYEVLERALARDIGPERAPPHPALSPIGGAGSSQETSAGVKR